MKTAIRWGACLVIAATSAASLANERAGALDALGVDQQTAWMERCPEPDVEVNDRDDVGAGTGEPSRPDESASFDERWLREREGYRDGGY